MNISLYSNFWIFYRRLEIYKQKPKNYDRFKYERIIYKPTNNVILIKESHEKFHYDKYKLFTLILFKKSNFKCDIITIFFTSFLFPIFLIFTSSEPDSMFDYYNHLSWKNSHILEWIIGSIIYPYVHHVSVVRFN